MRTIKIEEIVLGDRQRKVFDQAKIHELADSIEEKGLFHAVVCIDDSGSTRLIAGGRRLRAIRHLSEQNKIYSHDEVMVPPGEIPYVLINSDLDEIQRREAELEENLIRVDLSWQEKTAALDELHELRLARNPKHTVADTARELDQPGSRKGFMEHEIYRARLVASHLDSPEIANAKSLSQAASIVGRKLEAEFNVILVERGQGQEFKHTLIHGDFADIKGWTKSFSCIIADPPYGIGADKFGDAAQLTHTYADTEKTALDFGMTVFEIGASVTLDEAHLYMFCDIENFLLLRGAGESCGWKVWRTPLIWHKTSSASHAPALNRGFRRSYELILFASKGDKPLSQVYSDVIAAGQVRDKLVAAQKPTELYETLLGRSCLPGDKVLDPCCGSGTIFKAAEAFGLQAWGVEKDRGAYEIAQLVLSSLGEG